MLYDVMFVSSYIRKKGKKTYQSHYIAESYREHGKVKRRHLLNITRLPQEKRLLIKQILKENSNIIDWNKIDSFTTTSFGLSHTVLSILKEYKFFEMLPKELASYYPTIIAMIVNRLEAPCAKYSLKSYALSTDLPQLLHVTNDNIFHHNKCYEALDLLSEKQEEIELALYKQTNKKSRLFLYDLTSVYFEGRDAEIGKYGYSRDHRGDLLQIVVALLTDERGKPIAVFVLEGNTKDSQTVQNAVNRLKQKFGIAQICFVGDRGMVTVNNLEHIKNLQMDFIVALKHKEVLSLLKKHGYDQMGLFDEKEIADVNIDNRRLVVCRNPLAADDTKRRREKLLLKIDGKLKIIKERVWQKESNPTETEKAIRKKHRRLKNQAAIQKAADKIFSTYPLEKFYKLDISEDSFSFEKNEEEIKLAAQLDGVYVLETTIAKGEMNCLRIQQSYKLLKFVEYGWKRMKGNIEIRPVFHYKEKRIKGHVFICFLAFMIEQELFTRWKESGLKKKIEWDETILKIKQWSKTRVANNPTLKAIDSNFTPELAHILSLLRIPL